MLVLLPGFCLGNGWKAETGDRNVRPVKSLIEYGDRLVGFGSRRWSWPIQR